MSVIFGMCLQGLHMSCIRYGPAPNTIGGSRVVCSCACHRGQHPDDPDVWKASDADRMATYFAFEYGTDPRVDQLLDGFAAVPASGEATTDTEDGQ